MSDPHVEDHAAHCRMAREIIKQFIDPVWSGIRGRCSTYVHDA